MWVNWELVDAGCDREWRLVQDVTGLIIGGVRGTILAGRTSELAINEWGAWTDGAGGVKHIGKYVTQEFAKRAVMVGADKRNSVSLDLEFSRSPIRCLDCGNYFREDECTCKEKPTQIPLQYGERLNVRGDEWEVESISNGQVATIKKVKHTRGAKV